MFRWHLTPLYFPIQPDSNFNFGICHSNFFKFIQRNVNTCHRGHNPCEENKHLHICVCVCVREREREGGVTGCVCVYVREREKEKERERGRRENFAPQTQNAWKINPLTPNDHYSGCTAPLTSKRFILYIYSSNIGTEYFKHGIYSPFFLFKMKFVS